MDEMTVLKLKRKIKKKFKSVFACHPNNIFDRDVNLIIENNCECSNCGMSFFEMDEHPIFFPDDKQFLCDECYDENYREWCPICEESYDTKYFTSDFFVLNEELAMAIKRPPGIYKIIERPFYYGDCISGFDNFFDGAIKLVVSIQINQFKNFEFGEGFQKVISDTICPDCIDQYVRKSGFIDRKTTPIVLLKKYETSDFFEGCTISDIHAERQQVIHRRITCRGIIEQGNKVLL